MMYVEFALIVLAVGGVFAGLAWLADRRLDAPVAQVPRPDRHLPAEEYALLGDDYRDCVADYFRESRIRHTRNRFAVFSVTGADPEKSEDWIVPGPLTNKELTLGSHRK